ncbi:MAG: ABC transporter ATP-binding protein [Oscillospiraceae bacterium]|jgi:ABC-type sugar transport system ATPase subunit|nr:ABC transporter ATP-binding protein [Oscillospiraceae bacterium]
MSYLEMTGVTKTYRGAEGPVLRDFELSAEKGEILVILGASGCGKTTALKIVSGLERQDSGRVVLDGGVLDGLPPEKRSTAMVFQKSLLFRNMNVEENLSFAPRLGCATEPGIKIARLRRGRPLFGGRLTPRSELRRKTDEMLELLHLEGFGKKRVTELSGGQEQRVSLGRALMAQPKLLLLDEPLSALDSGLKWSLLAHIKELGGKLGATMLYVTHDQKEASAVADRIAFLHNGAITRCAAPYEFYSRPSSKPEADFFGWENYIPAEKTGARVHCALGDFDIPGARAASGQALLCVRPEAAVNIGAGGIRGVVASVAPQGLETLYEVVCAGARLKLAINARHAFGAGEEIAFDLDAGMVWAI